MSYKGRFTPKNPQKYIGDPTKIVYRSLWEYRIMQWLDKNSSVIAYASEEIAIPYKNPFDGKWHRYYPDFFVKIKNKHGVIVDYIIEVKPDKQCNPPKVPKRQTRKYIKEVVKYGVNCAKWKAAQSVCEEKGWKFTIWTEKNCSLIKPQKQLNG